MTPTVTNVVAGCQRPFILYQMPVGIMGNDAVSITQNWEVG